jgi:hypothetical protein
MKFLKYKYYAIAAFSIVIITALVLFFALGESSDDSGTRIYFFNAVQGRLEAEYRNLPQADNRAEIETIFRYLTEGPRNTAFTRVWTVDTEPWEFLRDYYLDDRILVAEFSHLYDEMPPMDEIIFRSAFTYTMTGLPYIDGVIFRTPSAEWRESAETIANSPSISSTRRQSEIFTLFFADESGEGLITEEYFASDVQLHRRTQDILETLIERQNTTGGILPLIPAETQIRRVIIDLSANSPGIYVDFSSEFHNRFSGTSSQARMMLQSIAHTVLEHNDQRRVFFLIDSERRDEFHGVTDFNLGFTMDETMMMGYTEVTEEETEQ